METTTISKCCRALAIPDVVVDKEIPMADLYKHPVIHYTCLECENDCEVEEVCADCLGTGEVPIMEYVYPGEPHMAPIGIKPCHCQLKEPSDMDDDS